MLVFGHRGAAGLEPENTLRAIRKAIEIGVDWVEIDVRRVDGRLITFHDDVLDRTTNGRGPLHRVSFEDLRELDAGGGERIPLLTEVVDAIDGRVGLNIELKEPGLAEAIAELSSQYCARQPAWHGRFLLSSFDQGETAVLARLDHEFLLGVLFSGDGRRALERARDLGAYSLNSSITQLTADLVANAHAHGIKIFVYTVNTLADIERCGRLGVDGVFSDYPDRVIEYRAATSHDGR